jgi:hypothetical protein
MSFHKQFSLVGETYQVSWEQRDFTKDVEALEPGIGGVLVDCGVMFEKPSSIFVSAKLMETDPKVGELSALHEHVCQCVGTMSCVDVERAVIEEAPSDEIRTNYIRIRSGLFVAITQLYPTNELFQQTNMLLQDLGSV